MFSRAAAECIGLFVIIGRRPSRSASRSRPSAIAIGIAIAAVALWNAIVSNANGYARTGLLFALLAAALVLGVVRSAQKVR